MTPSPLQLKKYHFTQVSVETSIPYSDPNFVGISAEDFDFNGVNIITEIGVALPEGQEENPKDFMIDFRLSIPNENGVQCPYKINVGVIGMFIISDKVDINMRENLVTVNGTSILFGCVREMVSNLTSRQLHGQLTLPTASFTDQIKKKSENIQDKQVNTQ